MRTGLAAYRKPGSPVTDTGRDISPAVRRGENEIDY